MMTTELGQSYQQCVRLARRHARHFYHGFRLLPREKRLAVCAIYAFLRLGDDIADEQAGAGQAETAMRRWRDLLVAAYSGEVEAHPVLPALRDVIIRYEIARELFEHVLDGIAMDLSPISFETFSELEHYCYLVAGVVGLLCLHVWGVTDWQTASDMAVACGTAFQLTNILRDIREDAMRGRVYLPEEDLARYGVSREDLLNLENSAAIHALILSEAERAEALYRSCRRLANFIMPDSRAAFLAMHGVYHALLREICAQPERVMERRIGVPAIVKLAIVTWSVVESRLMSSQWFHA